MGNHCANHVTPLYPQKLALTSPTGGGRSVGMVRSRTKATEFSLVFTSLNLLIRNWSLYPIIFQPKFYVVSGVVTPVITLDYAVIFSVTSSC